jgi:hypothetical protein
MGMRQMTFEIPEEVAEKFESEVPVPEQSAEVTKLLRRRVSRRTLTEEDWARVCEAANNDPETQEIEREMAALPDTMTEEWDDSVEQSATR